MHGTDLRRLPLCMTMYADIVPVHAILDEITTWFSLSRGQIVQISTKNSILSYFTLWKIIIRPTVPKLPPSQIHLDVNPTCHDETK